MIQEFGAKIKAGNQRVAAPLADIVIASNFQPKILDAAKDALAPITSYQKKERPFEQFGFILKIVPSYYLGALFELLPRTTALEAFKAEFLSSVFSLSGYIKAGHSLLRFSSPGKAAEFARALRKYYPSKTAKFLSTFKNTMTIITYKWRRYDVDDVLRALRKRPKMK